MPPVPVLPYTVQFSIAGEELTALTAPPPAMLLPVRTQPAISGDEPAR
jgi:hypothetical protein